MTYKSSEAAPQGRLTVEPHPPMKSMPPLYTETQPVSRGQLEAMLTAVWNEPANIVSCHVGGHGPSYYARSESMWMSVELTSSGFIPLWQTQESDRREYNEQRYAASIGRQHD